MKSKERRNWLMKCEPSAYSIEDLQRDKRTSWEGVRNYQARNSIRDGMRVGDRVLFYASNADPSGVSGIAEVCSEPRPDPSAFDDGSDYFDPKGSPENPVWFLVDICFVERFARTVSLEMLRATPGLEKMVVLQKGSRLSVQPVTPEEFAIVVELGKSFR